MKEERFSEQIVGILRRRRSGLDGDPGYSGALQTLRLPTNRSEFTCLYSRHVGHMGGRSSFSEKPVSRSPSRWSSSTPRF
jgi:hypothetical protein